MIIATRVIKANAMATTQAGKIAHNVITSEAMKLILATRRSYKGTI